MKLNQVMTICGMKAFKGDVEGTHYDNTKVYAMTDMDESKGNAKGFATVEYAFGTSAEFEKYKAVPFPFKADVEMEFVTNGKAQKMIIHTIKPQPGQVAPAKV